MIEYFKFIGEKPSRLGLFILVLLFTIGNGIGIVTTDLLGQDLVGGILYVVVIVAFFCAFMFHNYITFKRQIKK